MIDYTKKHNRKYATADTIIEPVNSVACDSEPMASSDIAGEHPPPAPEIVVNWPKGCRMVIPG